MELRDKDGAVLEIRQADNAVMQSGGMLVAQLFAGIAGARGITHMGVGVSDAPETDQYGTSALTNNGPGKLSGATEAAIPPEAIVVDPPDPTTRTVKVRIRATLPASAAVGTVREAGLLAHPPAAPPQQPPGPLASPVALDAALPIKAPLPIRAPLPPPTTPVLYNRVTFAPLNKGADHELTMFWEVSFPYGDLQELA
jgi:hypothetical protein